jgi:hypothetical protein
MRIRIRWKNQSVEATLEDTPTAQQVVRALPCTAAANTWGQEVYFKLPVKAKLEPDAKAVVDPGAVCFWVQGSSMAIPFGPTPASHGEECRLVTPCNVMGKIDGDPQGLAGIRDGDPITVELAE